MEKYNSSLSPTEKAAELLTRMPKGNAKIHCINMIKPGGILNKYWAEVKKELDNL